VRLPLSGGQDRIPKSGKLKNKVEKIGVFLAVEMHHTKHHDSPRNHHEITTIYHHKNTRKSQNPRKKTLRPPKFFLHRNSTSHSPSIKRGKKREG
jgi:hypothetical protein